MLVASSLGTDQDTSFGPHASSAPHNLTPCRIAICRVVLQPYEKALVKRQYVPLTQPVTTFSVVCRGAHATRAGAARRRLNSCSRVPQGGRRPRASAREHASGMVLRFPVKGAQEPPAPASAAPLGFAAPTEWSDTPCAASPWRVSNSALPPNGSYLVTLPAHVR